MASEIREENKVREKIAQLLKQHALGDGWNFYVVADLILQSPDLRVTLVEPRFSVVGTSVRDGGYVIGGFSRQELAQEYADFKNSKEPK